MQSFSTMQTTKSHAVLLASPGMGHLFPTIELGKRLATHHNLHITVFVIPNDSSSEIFSQFINSSTVEALLDIIVLPYVDISTILPPNPPLIAQLMVMMHESMPALRSSISALKHRPTALVFDMFGLEAMAIADEFGMSKYVFMTTNAWFLALVTYSPALDKKRVIDEHLNQKQPLKIPGCSPVRFEDSPEGINHPDDPLPDGFVQMGKTISTADGILVNTWEDLESKTLDALRDTLKLRRSVKAPVYPVGPLVASSSQVAPLGQSRVVLDWLDQQPDESVLYVSFGSGGALSSEQTLELAWGLQMSQQRFIWVLRPPLDQGAVSKSYLTAAGSGFAGGHLDYLPEGFLTKTRDLGLVVPMWAPQTEILSHPSVGGFLTHCGWNSTLESIVNGVPMIGWPLFAEQKMNATMLAEDIGVAVRTQVIPSPECLVGREEIETLVRRMMVDREGSVMRNKVKELKESAETASTMGGSSYCSLSMFAKGCQNSLHLQAQGA